MMKLLIIAIAIIILTVVHESYSQTCQGSFTAYQTRYRRTITYYRQSYSRSCGRWGWRRCRYYRTASYYRAVSYRVSIRSYRLMCCSGYSGSPPNCQPICTRACRNGGTCSAPDTCRCVTGWTGAQCQTDINECARSRPCQQHCINRPGSYTCACYGGYLPTSSSHVRCVDINECTSSPCGHTCVNTPGSFACACRRGYALDSDGRTCNLIPPHCLSSPCEHTCTEGTNTFQCSCNAGYSLNSDRRSCSDVNECASSPCQHDCTNTPGSFHCSCQSGYELSSNGLTCREIDECSSSPCEHSCANTLGSFRCSCRSGYTLDTNGRSCRDINECASSPCDHICTNTPGSFECSCNSGFVLESDERTCTDFPDCSLSPCQQTCTEVAGTPNSFQCSCLTGYSLATDGQHCNDINECTSSSSCGQTCTNVQGSFQCSCNNGYLLDSNRRSCIDINECPTSSCEQTCTNTVGSFACSCGSGYSLNSNGHSCDNINECEIGRHCEHGCTDTIGSFICTCLAGYTLNSDGRSCDDINECASSPCQQICANTPGSFVCACNSGYTLDNNGLTCTDNVECASNPCDQICVNHPGYHECSCREGYTLRNSQYCDDIDECVSSPCGQICSNTDGSYTCSCRNGYLLGSDGSNCTDINECLLSPCGHTCTNTVGSFECSCFPGYLLDDNGLSCNEVDECRSSPCQHICANTPGSFTCSCHSGYILDNNQLSCIDINECLSSPCGQTCSNNPGSFQCSCAFGYVLDNNGRSCSDIDECSSNPCQHTCTNTQGGYNCTCRVGYTVNGSRCNDIDECATSPCGQTCTNTGGSFICSCGIGYELDSDGSTCNDINECNDFPCHQICTNSPGSYQCSCFTGYSLNDTICTDVNECTSSPCGHICVNNEGSYECSCNEGYVLNTNRHACDDVDECTSSPCQQICANTPGSYQCNCQSGYTIAGSMCNDIDECISSPCEDTCTNNPGSFVCSCDPGYVLNTNQRTCDDVDECLLSPCGQVCTNTGGSYECSCHDGFELDNDGRTCNDIDECDSSFPCSQRCTNTIGSFRCSCRSGYTVDGILCNDINECDYGISPCEDICTNTDGSYECSCSDHHEMLTEDGDCVDINECEVNPRICEYHCTNIIGGYYCSCATGYSLVDGHNCTDTDECAATSSPCDHICTNEVGSYECSCNNGYLLDSDGSSCNDINECNNSFPCSQVCTNTLGSYQCSCNSGYVADGNTCLDINECTTSAPCNQSCANTVGSFECSCDSGYELASDERSCNDIDECQISTPCSQLCINTPGSFQCSCNGSGYTLDGTRCIDINECNNTPRPCEDICTNTIGSYICSCSDTSEYITEDGNCTDIDECATLQPCNQTCHNRVGGYHCTCNVGYSLVGGHDCTDIDECATSSPCGQSCANSVGSYECSCNVGYTLDDDRHSCNDIDECAEGFPCDHICNNTIGSFVCSCESGFALDGNICIDIDECLSSPCAHDCTNTVGSFECPCNVGYELGADQLSCHDIDECHSTFPCSQNCTNTPGSFQCSCSSGYTQDGTRCNDINECDRTPRPCGGICTNTDGSYECSCSNHYEQVNENGNCVDIDECKANPTICQYQCTNIIGGYYCSCPTGYSLVSGHNCSEIDECDASSPPCDQICTNTAGSFLCSCEIGYVLNIDQRTCNDTNECANNPCQQSCTNIMGSFECSCKNGYTANGTRCIDINECHLSVSPCEEDCVNTDGGYVCSCRDNSEMVTDDGECVDFDECTIPGICQDFCTNLIGGYYCTCQAGYALINGRNCTDIDECATSSPCQHSCTNSVGSYRCSCYQGYVLDSDGIMCNALPTVVVNKPAVLYTNSMLVVGISWMAAEFDRNILQLNGYRVTVSFQGRTITNSPLIPADVTSIVMSDYFTNHPQYFLTYNVVVQALYGEGLNAANNSNLVVAETNVLRNCSVTSPIANTVRVLCNFLRPSGRINVIATCITCQGIQAPISAVGNNPLDVSTLRSENYTLDVMAVDRSNKRLGNNSVTLQTTVSTAPANAPSVTVTIQSSTAVVLSWEPPALNQLNGIITNYHLMVTQTEILYLENQMIVSPIALSANLTYNTTTAAQVLDFLHPSYTYTFTMAATTTIGTSPYSEPQTITMPTAAPAESPNNVTVTVESSSSFMLSWDPPSLEQQNGQLSSYHVLIVETQMLYLENGTILSVGSGLNRTYNYNVTASYSQLFNALHPSYNYSVSVAAATSAGVGPFSLPFSVTLPDDVPTASPQSVHLEAQSSDSVMLSWKPPLLAQQNGRLVNYHVVIMETQIFYLDNGTVISSVGFNLSTIYNATGNHAQLISMLHPNYNYTIRMAAVNGAGIGPFSTTITVTTLEDAPSKAPPNVQATAESPFSITLSWESLAVEQQNGRLIQYHVFIVESQVVVYYNNRTITVPGINRNVTYNISEGRSHLVIDLLPNHNYTISVAAATSAGIGPYSHPITVTTQENVCEQEYSYGLVWEKLSTKQISRVDCSALHPRFYPEVFITRLCSNDRQWGIVDFSSCTMRLEDILLVMMELRGSNLAENAASIIDTVVESVGRNYPIAESSHQIYTTSEEDVIVGFVTVNSSLNETNARNVMEDIRSMNAQISFITTFQPGGHCFCNKSLLANSVNYVCAGLNTSPCMVVNGSYQCGDGYVGNGTNCTVEVAPVVNNCSSLNCKPEPEKLPVESYIGCGISIVCLLLTIIVILIFKNTTFHETYNLVHLNLCIALLLGSLVFAGGIETAKDSKEGCIVVTALLHFFILATLSWTICEGIVIYIMLVSDTYNGFFKSMYFLLAIGWGPAIAIAVTSAAIFHDDYGIYDGNQLKLCWIPWDNQIIWTFIAPIIVILVIDFFLLSASLFKVCQLKRTKHELSDQSDDEDSSIAASILLSIFIILPLIGATWVLALVFMLNSESLALVWIFIILASLQGIAIFFFFVLRNRSVVYGVRSCFKQDNVKATSVNYKGQQRQYDNFTLKGRKDDPHHNTDSDHVDELQTTTSTAEVGFFNPAYEEMDDCDEAALY